MRPTHARHTTTALRAISIPLGATRTHMPQKCISLPRLHLVYADTVLRLVAMNSRGGTACPPADSDFDDIMFGTARFYFFEPAYINDALS